LFAVIAMAVGVAVSGPAAASTPTSSRQALARQAANNLLPVQHRIDAQLQLTPGGRQVSRTEIAWHGGQVLMFFPLAGHRTAAPDSLASSSPGASVQPLDIHGCPSYVFGNDWYCFYQDKNWGGRRLQWSDAYHNPVYFSDYGFEKQTSSWVNGGGKTIFVDNSSGGQLWQEAAHTVSSYVGDARNDKAWSFTTS